jgi:hypothetical protein
MISIPMVLTAWSSVGHLDPVSPSSWCSPPSFAWSSLGHPDPASPSPWRSPSSFAWSSLGHSDASVPIPMALTAIIRLERLHRNRGALRAHGDGWGAPWCPAPRAHRPTPTTLRARRLHYVLQQADAPTPASLRGQGQRARPTWSCSGP